jgi:hypothetical protein
VKEEPARRNVPQKSHSRPPAGPLRMVVAGFPF